MHTRTHTHIHTHIYIYMVRSLRVTSLTPSLSYQWWPTCSHWILPGHQGSSFQIDQVPKWPAESSTRVHQEHGKRHRHGKQKSLGRSWSPSSDPPALLSILVPISSPAHDCRRSQIIFNQEADFTKSSGTGGPPFTDLDVSDAAYNTSAMSMSMC